MHSKYSNFTAVNPAIEQRVSDMVSKLTLEEKIELLGGGDGGTKSCEKVGFPALWMADGPLGIHWHCESSVAYPATLMLAASWNRDLAERFGRAIGRDGRARGIHILLAPGVNIYRSALCGRNFEYLGEDPKLSAQMVVPVVQGCQDEGVAVTMKHYALNNQEYQRHHVSSDADERTLREVYLPAFEAAIKEGGAACVMTGYNLVNGVHCSENFWLLRKILRGEWGFDGIVMSDWVSVYNAELPLLAGLDLEMPTAVWMNSNYLVPAVKDGRISEEDINEKVRNLFRMAACFGWLDKPQKDESIPLEDEMSAEVACDMVREGAVLLKNENSILPLDLKKHKKIALVGPGSYEAILSAGGSAYTAPWRKTTILEEVRKLVGNKAEILHTPGVDAWANRKAMNAQLYTTPEGTPGLKAEFFWGKEFAGEAFYTEVLDYITADWVRKKISELGCHGKFSLRFSGKIHLPTSDTWRLLMRTDEAFVEAFFDGEKLFSLTDNFKGSFANKTIEAGSYDLRIDYIPTRGYDGLGFGALNIAENKREFEKAVALAREADVVVFVGGHTSETEGEGWDRPFAMPEETEDLLAALADANPNTIALITAGGHVDMSKWCDKVPAIMHTFYHGQEGGRAIAELLLGKVNPSGKLPFTAEHKIEDRSSFDSYHAPENVPHRRITYSDGIFGGYRHFDRSGIAPLFPFGFGLSYTTFSLSNLKVENKSKKRRKKLVVTCEVTNTGERTGAEVVQVYVNDPEAAVPRPVKELKGFAKVFLKPGKTKSVKITLEDRDFQYFVPGKGWTFEPGNFQILVGTSSKDTPLEHTLCLE